MKTKSNPSLRGVANAQASVRSTDPHLQIQKSKIDCHDFANAKQAKRSFFSKSRNDEVKRDELPYKSHNDKNYRRFAIFFVGSFCPSALLVVAFIGLLWLYDPLMLFHKPYFREQTIVYEKNLPINKAIDFLDFDSILLGSSMFQNTLAKEADEKIGGKWFNFAIGSSRIDEREALLQYILKHKQIKQIAYSLDNYILVNGEFNKVQITSLQNINNTFWGNLKIYFDKHFIKCAVKWSKKFECVGRTFKEYGPWYHKRAYGFKKWNFDEKQRFLQEVKIYQNNSYKNKNIDMVERNNIRKYIKEHIFVYVEQNPQINFHFVLPTQSRFFWNIPYYWNDGERFGTDKDKYRSPKRYFDDWKHTIKWFIQESAKYKNVKIYGLDDLDYADNLNNYSDARHYRADMNSMQLDAIANGTHILTAQNIDSYLATMESKIKNYDIAPLIEQIKAWEAQNKSN